MLILPFSDNTPSKIPTDTELRRGLTVAKSPIEGLGLFASQNFSPHQIIWSEVLKSKFANPESGGPLRWANHSDSPNSVLVLRQQPPFEISLVAVRAISLGDEVTYNYGIFGHTGYKAACNCGQPNCKGFFVLRQEWGEKK